MNKVEIFVADTLEELETTINKWNSEKLQEPLSVSLTMNGIGQYVAAVVVRECSEYG